MSFKRRCCVYHIIGASGWGGRNNYLRFTKTLAELLLVPPWVVSVPLAAACLELAERLPPLDVACVAWKSSVEVVGGRRGGIRRFASTRARGVLEP